MSSIWRALHESDSSTFEVCRFGQNYSPTRDDLEVVPRPAHISIIARRKSRRIAISIQWLEGFECAADRNNFEALGEA
jgi:hypothetical protein